ncbi:MAG TPA: hypothetical protein DEO36_04105 [Flavobacteriaceae bacterium]|jgi:hypothetical protein|nr:hypothetical protein [Flavobacteriaceae bacterium]
MKSLFKITLFSLITIFALTSSIAQSKSENLFNKKQTEILLIGTFHFNNPGADVVKTKTFDINTKSSQNDLKEIAKKITEFKPTKIFVEWPYKQQNSLDSTYAKFKKDGIYKTDEIYQIAFRAGKLIDEAQIIAIDYNDTNFPFGKLMASIKKNKQTDIEMYLTATIKRLEKDTNDKIDSNISLKEMLYDNNTKEERDDMNEFYEKILTVGDNEDFIGAYLTSEWMRRNLYMWSLLKKNTTINDERVMVLLGSSHIAMIKNYIDANEDWKTVELIDVVENK